MLLCPLFASVTAALSGFNGSLADEPIVLVVRIVLGVPGEPKIVVHVCVGLPTGLAVDKVHVIHGLTWVGVMNEGGGVNVRHPEAIPSFFFLLTDR